MKQRPSRTMAKVVERNIEALLARRQQEDKTKTAQDRIAAERMGIETSRDAELPELKQDVHQSKC